MNIIGIRNLAFVLSVSSLVILISPVEVWAAQAKVDLGTADSYAVLGASAVTNTGSSVINGNLGVSPGTAVSGFLPGIVNGSIHAADAAALQAQNDLTTAYNDAAGRLPCSDLSGQDLGGKTLTPGVYCYSSSAQLTGKLTLDAQGDSSAVFVFKISSSLTTASSSSVMLINSAQSCNVFWQVGSSATLGTTTDFRGNILALASITLNTGATVNGRVLARSGAVTLDSNTITAAVCVTPTLAVSSDSELSTTVNQVPGLNYCPPISDQTVTPMIIESKRVNSTSIFITWGPYSGVDTFNVKYGFEEGNLLYNVDVTGFSTTINDLHPNQPIWVQIAARNDCQIGTYGEVKLVGSPRMPNTGFDSKTSLFSVLSQVKDWLWRTF